MPYALMVEDDDEEGGEQVDEQESTAKFTEKVRSILPMGLQEIVLFSTDITDILIQNEMAK